MPYINLSTLTYPATNAFPGGIWEDTRDPTSNDYRNFHIGVTWINLMSQKVWFMVDKTATFGTWVQAATSGTGILTLTGNTGGAVSADPSHNVTLIGAGTLSIAGSPGTHVLTISQNGTVATSYVEDAGSAIPTGGVLNIIGGSGISTAGAGNTVTITATSAVPLHFTEDLGSAIPSANNLNILGGAGISTSGAGSTVTIATAGSVATTYNEDTGSAVPSAHILKIVGGTGISTAGAGNTVTIANSSKTGSVAFSAFLSSTQLNVTGDGTNYIVPFDSVLYNLGAAYNGTGIFTAPVTANYLFSTSVNFVGSTTQNSGGLDFIINGTVVWHCETGNPVQIANPGGASNYVGTAHIPLNAGDAVSVRAGIGSTTKTVSIAGDVVQKITYFCGFLLF